MVKEILGGSFISTGLMASEGGCVCKCNCYDHSQEYGEGYADGIANGANDRPAAE
ncbi:MAG: hypothetical protein IBX60_08015 [Candidatus Aminicenantes bacterium]|nr:hypothetical protein [Candidatus Aminicenantes bacterium]